MGKALGQVVLLGWTARQAENSEVLPPGSVAVAVTNEPLGTTTGSTTPNAALPVMLFVTVIAPR